MNPATARLDGWRLSNRFPNFIILQSAFREESILLIKDYARKVNCQNDGSPTCRCPSCVMLKDGVNRNYIEAPGDLKVEDMESLLEKLILQPDPGTRFVIFTIPGVSAILQNKLLKLLEEGIERTVFVFVHTGGNLLQPIKSRATILWMQHNEAWERLMGKGKEFEPEDLEYFVMASGQVPGIFKNLIEDKNAHFFVMQLKNFFQKQVRADLPTKMRDLDEKTFYKSVENVILLALNDPTILKEWPRPVLHEAMELMHRFYFFSKDRVLAAVYMKLHMEGV